MSPRRRDVLTFGSVSLATALAGCTSLTDGGENYTENGTGNGTANNSSAGSNRSVDEFETTDMGQDVTVDGTAVAVSDPAVRSSLVYETGREQFALASSVGSQYLLVHVDAGEGGPAPDQFQLVTGGVGNYRASTPTSGNPLAERGDSYAPEEGRSSGWLAFTLPGGIGYSSAAVVVEGTDTGWALGDDVVSTLSEPVPAFTLSGVDAPESVVAGTQFDVTATFANDSDTDGTFRGVVAVSTPNQVVTPFAVDVAPGETGEYTEQFAAPTTAEEVAFTVRTVGGDQSVTVPIEGGAGNDSNASGNATEAAGNATNTSGD